ncbi:SRPBCC family protein [Frankia sp. Ag45/Mut15]|uniref:SRPBCC family protein n=1 Tax=Frankia umida TaxID=573489 RepID=A0ABT0JT47_9ACTN|nr:SRPBCC family protein [Frankia umida]MCK9874626.1 SRPBCC family protein [Frankia umida]
MWEYEHSATVEVSAEAVWKLYTNPESWGTWDSGIVGLTLDGPFVPGTTGKLTPKGQDPVTITLVEVVENRSFIDETNLGGIVLRAIHRLEPVDGGRTRITHRIEITGPEADTLGPQIGPAVTAGVPETITTLARLAAA